MPYSGAAGKTSDPDCEGGCGELERRGGEARAAPFALQHEKTDAKQCERVKRVIELAGAVILQCGGGTACKRMRPPLHRRKAQQAKSKNAQP
jgi:hypothetical protein